MSDETRSERKASDRTRCFKSGSAGGVWIAKRHRRLCWCLCVISARQGAKDSLYVLFYLPLSLRGDWVDGCFSFLGDSELSPLLEVLGLGGRLPKFSVTPFPTVECG